MPVLQYDSVEAYDTGVVYNGTIAALVFGGVDNRSAIFKKEIEEAITALEEERAAAARIRADDELMALM